MNETAITLLVVGLVALITPILVAVITIFAIRQFRPQDYLHRVARKYSVPTLKLH